MAIQIIDGQTFSMGGVDLSDHLIDLEVSETAALLNSSTQGVANQTRYRGKKHFTARVRLQQDYASSNVHDTVQAACDAVGGAVVCILKPGVTSGDPIYTGSFAVGDYTSIPGGEGVAEIEISLEAAGAIVITATA
tara:strand:+ start:444 stop:851 length:408 start_codon:yes stop_codon:yes gene_type:complete